MTRSKEVDTKIRELWAILATVAAAKAVDEAKWDRIASAERLAGVTARWLDRAGARATGWTYTRPRV